MKKNVLVFGLISGIIITAMMVYSTIRCCTNPEAESSLVMGFASMIVAFSFIFIGIKNFRDKYNDGVISFGKAFKIGLLITLIASSMYVLVWLVEYYVFLPDFVDKYSEHVLYQARLEGLSQVQLDEKVKEMATFKEWYQNPFFVVLFTFAEVLPVGLTVTLIAALILKKGKKERGRAEAVPAAGLK